MLQRSFFCKNNHTGFFTFGFFAYIYPVIVAKAILRSLNLENILKIITQDFLLSDLLLIFIL